MTRIESKEVRIERPATELGAFLHDMTNFRQLLPEGRISEWTASKDECSFKVQGAATIGLRIAEGSTDQHVKMVATDRSPFPFTLDVRLLEQNGTTSGKLEFNSDLNPMLRLMVEKPLKNLFDHIADRMAALHE
ncbi:MAG: hypothetical protein KDB88_07470 [Flavobacteriales bacterium]|nr:hypothetical protein [Flavobacteriales bacterium]